MAIKPIRPLYSPAATATNGSDTITVTGDVDCSYIYDGFLVALGTRQVVEAVRGTPPDGSGNSTITLRRNWDAANTTAPLLGWNSIEGLPAAINQLRQIIGDSQDINDQLLPLANLMGTGIIRKTGTETYELLSDTSAGRAILQASDATAQRVALGLGTAATRNTGANPDQIPLNSNLGTAATANVTTSPTDTTAGRLLKVGDFGVGAVIPSNTDLNSLVTPATYYITSTTTPNLPDNILGILVVASTGIRSTQTFIHTSSTAQTRIRNRNYNGTSWSDWVEIYHTGNILGTVSQSGGIPTGAIIERGSNANGEFVRFADGTQKCWLFQSDLTSIGSNNNSNLLWTYPASFSPSTTPPVVVGLAALNASNFTRAASITCGRNNTASEITTGNIYNRANLIYRNNFETESTFHLTAFAVGRWY